MKRLWTLFAQPQFHAFLFSVGLVVLNWPFLGTLRQKPPGMVLLTILMLWVAAILLLFMINRSCRRFLNNEVRNRGKSGDA
ncbi:MAG: hypothetical protein GX443_16990 [Deltaproteobacteria bacterium]|nr:hypothetical protein [Deltaproteobacteria bacterium]